MKQTRFMSMLETGISTATGFGISLAAQWVCLPLLGVQIHASQNLAFALIMTVVSLARGFVLRRIFEALHIRVPMSPALLAIAAERRRQIEVEGWTPERDAEHLRGDLALAASCYAAQPSRRRIAVRAGMANLSHNDAPAAWPWSRAWWKPEDDRRDLARAGALIVAEMDVADWHRKRGRG